MKRVRENLKFSQIIKYAKEGPFRKEQFGDGWYVIGEGNVIPAIDEEDANDILKNMKNKI
jgi:hydrogenase maturation factor